MTTEICGIVFMLKNLAKQAVVMAAHMESLFKLQKFER